MFVKTNCNFKRNSQKHVCSLFPFYRSWTFQKRKLRISKLLMETIFEHSFFLKFLIFLRNIFRIFFRHPYDLWSRSQTIGRFLILPPSTVDGNNIWTLVFSWNFWNFRENYSNYFGNSRNYIEISIYVREFSK